MNKKIALIVVILFCLLLSACSEGESFWVEAFIRIWSTEVGITTEQNKDPDLGKVTDYLIDKAVSQITRDEEANALDAAEETIKEIEKADQIMADAMKSKDPEKLSQAQALRPKDVTYVEAEAATWVAAGNNAAAQSAITKSDNVTINAVMQGANCRSTRLSQLRIRRDTLLKQADIVSAEAKEGIQNQLFVLADEATSEINALTSGASSPFCAQFGKDN